MSRCTRARDLFGSFWDDEISRAEREWLEGHLSGCSECRREYEQYARSLELVASLPRHEASEGLVDRVLARTRQAASAPDVIGPRRVFADDRPVWIPVAAAAAIVALAFAAVLPWIAPRGGVPSGSIANNVAPAPAAPVAQPRLVSVPAPAPETPRTDVPRSAAPSGPVVLADSLFDHTEDVEFILDPVTLRRGRAHTVSRLPQGVQAEQAVITF